MNEFFTSVITPCSKELTPAEFDVYVMDRTAKAEANAVAAKALCTVLYGREHSIDPATARELIEAVGDAILESRRAGFRDAVGSSEEV